EAFSLYLNEYTYYSFIEDEKQYQVFLESALFMADQGVDSQEMTAQGLLDVHFVSPKGEHFIIELKVYREKTPKSSDSPETNPDANSADPPEKGAKPKHIPPPLDDQARAKLRKSMTPIAEAALIQIKEKYVDKYRGEGQPIAMVALVMARRTFVLAKFEVMEPK
ncbi:MAG: hypothetical protein LBS60_07690, partial [Deltaproteobacteria bacterium]|nr:hypothetical protein [Deltaproteobacteria bacterium]